MELGEATELSDCFVTSLVFKVQSLPLGNSPARTRRWAEEQASSLSARAALDERRRHVGRFSSWRRSDHAAGRSLHLSISAVTVDLATGKCPALIDRRCGIYARRPLTCRTVPLHYSRPSSALIGYLDRFVTTPGFACDTSDTAPVVLAGSCIVDPAYEQARRKAMSSAQADVEWKNELLARMAGGTAATAAGLPTIDSVRQNSDAGFATLLPMLTAWRVARDSGKLDAHRFRAICADQAALIRAALSCSSEASSADDLFGLLADYEAEQFI